ncbi:MAG TPA: ATP-binding protein [Phycisphaerales bacterium]|nr:ATP-binding protein [Phycisphaerales bacterium]
MLNGLLLGFGLGTLLTVAVAVVLIRRHLRRVRAAERRARAAERLAEIGSMTSGLAHEIKNPLSTIGLNAQLLLEGVEDLAIDDQERSRLVNRTKALRRETERLSGILQDFLQFAGQVVLDPRQADVNELVSELVDFYFPEAERQGVRLRADLHPQPLLARVDVKHVKQALLNLMLNATQAMAQSKGGGGVAARELILRTEPFRDDHDQSRSDCVRIHVIDTGPGIAPEVVERIFQPYFTTKAGGSGLGLPTARRLIQEHAGRLEVHSEPGKGSDFMVVLPVDGPPNTPEPAALARRSR